MSRNPELEANRRIANQATTTSSRDSIISATPPERPYDGMLWVDTSSDPILIKQYDITLHAFVSPSVVVGQNGFIRGGQSDYNTDTGFFLGYSGGEYKFSLGDPAGDSLNWDGSTLTVKGSIDITSFPDLPSDTTLVHHWSFDEGQGTVAIDEAGNNNGTLTNTPTYIDGVSGLALDFDQASDEYVDLGNDTQLDGATSFSISFWCKPDSLPFGTNDGIYARGSTGQRCPWIWGASGNSYLRMQIETTTGGAADISLISDTLTAAVWQHLVMTWDGTTAKSYLNGVLSVNTDTSTGNTLVNTDGNNYIGFIVGFDKWDGGIDEFRVYKNKTLTANEVKALYLYPSGSKLSGVKQLGGAYASASSGARMYFNATDGLVVASSAQNVFQALVSGTDVGDVIMGDEATGQFAKWDESAGTFIVNNSPLSNEDIYGDGSDGNVTLSATTTLTSDMFYNDLDINGEILNTGGYRIFVAGTLSGTGTIRNNGNAGGAGTTGGAPSVHNPGTGGTAGSAASGNSVPPGTLGVIGVSGGSGAQGGSGGGSTGTGGTAGINTAKCTTNSSGVAGGAGGDGGYPGVGTGYDGGAGGGDGDATGTILNKIRTIISAYLLSDHIGGLTNFGVAGGSAVGGGGGGGDAKNIASCSGGGGGGSRGSGSTGGITWLAARTITYTGAIESIGGDGGDGGRGTNGSSIVSEIPYRTGGGGGGGAGGSGGGGGTIIIITSSSTSTYSTDVTGGIGGDGGGEGYGMHIGVIDHTYDGTAGADGLDGNSGNVITLIK